MINLENVSFISPAIQIFFSFKKTVSSEPHHKRRTTNQKKPSDYPPSSLVRWTVCPTDPHSRSLLSPLSHNIDLPSGPSSLHQMILDMLVWIKLLRPRGHALLIVQ